MLAVNRWMNTRQSEEGSTWESERVVADLVASFGFPSFFWPALHGLGLLSFLDDIGTTLGITLDP